MNVDNSNADFKFITLINIDLNTVFAFHKNDKVFDLLTPKFADCTVLSCQKFYVENAKVELLIHKFGLPVKFVVGHSDFIDNKQFCDYQIIGPFKSYKHIHLFENDNNATKICDLISLKLPFEDNLLFGFIVDLIKRQIINDFTRLFNYRKNILLNFLPDYNKYKEIKQMNIAISGTSGLVGKHLETYLCSMGHKVLRMVRNKTNDENSIYYNYENGQIDSAKLEGIDCVIHLAGENIANKNWTDTQKKILLESRVKSTKLISKTVANLKNKPKVFICASAIGIYGDRGQEDIDERSLSGQGFLSDLCKQWEASTLEASQAGIRTVNARIGLVLALDGGVLAKILPLFKLGGGGILGNGKQYMSWIAIDDIVSSIYEIINNDKISGPVNLVAPNSLTNIEFTKVLGSVLARPTLFPAPAFALKMLMGQMAEELLLSGAKVNPKVLLDNNYKFKYPDLKSALKHILGK